MNDNDVVVLFCSPKTAKEMDLRDDVAVVTGLLSDDAVVVVKRDEFVEWLLEKDNETD